VNLGQQEEKQEN